MKVYLENFETFEEDIDQLLNKYDKSLTGLFGKNETKEFMEEISHIINKAKAKHYVENKKEFDDVFNKVDHEKTGYICKPEMAKVIKHLFSPKNERDQNGTLTKPKKMTSFFEPSDPKFQQTKETDFNERDS